MQQKAFDKKDQMRTHTHRPIYRGNAKTPMKKHENQKPSDETQEVSMCLCCECKSSDSLKTYPV